LRLLLINFIKSLHVIFGVLHYWSKSLCTLQLVEITHLPCQRYNREFDQIFSFLVLTVIHPINLGSFSFHHSIMNTRSFASYHIVFYHFTEIRLFSPKFISFYKIVYFQIFRQDEASYSYTSTNHSDLPPFSSFYKANSFPTLNYVKLLLEFQLHFNYAILNFNFYYIKRVVTQNTRPDNSNDTI